MNSELAALWQAVDRDRERFIQAVKAMPESVQGEPAPNHTWTPVQILDHLVIVEAMYAGFLQQTDPAAIQGKKPSRNILLRLIQHAMKKKMQVPTMKDMEPGRKTLDLVLTEWEGVRRFLKKGFPKDADLDTPWIQHAMLGVLSTRQVLELIQMHQQYHLPQLGVKD